MCRQWVRRALLIWKQSNRIDNVVSGQQPEVTKRAAERRHGKRRWRGVDGRRADSGYLVIEEPVNLVGTNSGGQWHVPSTHQLVD